MARSAKVVVEPEEAPVIEKPEDEIEVVTDDVVAAPAEETPVVKTEPEKPADDVDAAVTELKTQLENERLARVAAENRAQASEGKANELANEVKTFRSREHENQFNLVASQLEAVTREADNVQTQLEAAYAAQDFAAAAKLQRQLGRLESRADQLEQGRDALEARKVAAPADGEHAQPVTRTESNDPVGDYIRNLNVSQGDKDYLNSHRDLVTDQAKWAKLTSAAGYALNSKGLKPGSAEFYAFLDEDLGYKQPAAKQETSAPQPKQPAKTYSAPPSREGNAMSGQRNQSQRVRLSPDQRAAAKASGLSDAQYAKNLIDLVKEGKLPENTVEYVN